MNETTYPLRIPGLSNDEYHAHKAIGSSGLIKLIQQSPLHYKAYLEGERVETDAMRFGTAIHMALLEPENFKKTYVEKPEGMSFATKEGREWKKEHEGRAILTSDQFAACRGIWRAVYSHPKAKALLSDGDAEDSYFWEDPITGLLCKCRPDYLKGKHIIDIKTTESATRTNFQKSINSYRYDIQAYFYMHGMSQALGPDVELTWLVIEKNPPYALAFYTPGKETLERAYNEFRCGMEKLKICTANDYWPGYDEQTEPVEALYFGI